MPRAFVLSAAMLFIFVSVAGILLKVMPGPLKDSDFLVIGSVATLVSLLAAFLLVWGTSGKSANVFFKRRKKGP